MDEHFEQGTRVCLSRINDPMADRVPSPAMKHRAGGIGDRVTGISSPVREHVIRNPKKSLSSTLSAGWAFS